MGGHGLRGEGVTAALFLRVNDYPFGVCLPLGDMESLRVVLAGLSLMGLRVPVLNVSSWENRGDRKRPIEMLDGVVYISRCKYEGMMRTPHDFLP